MWDFFETNHSCSFLESFEKVCYAREQGFREAHGRQVNNISVCPVKLEHITLMYRHGGEVQFSPFTFFMKLASD